LALIPSYLIQPSDKLLTLINLTKVVEIEKQIRPTRRINNQKNRKVNKK